MKQIRKIKIMVIASLGLFTITGTVRAAPVTVDFSVLTETIDITTNGSPNGYTLGGVTFGYDNFGIAENFALIDNNGPYGSTAGNLLFNFGTPTAGLSFDFSLPDVPTSAAPLPDGLIITLKYGQVEVTNLTIATGTFAPYQDDPSLGEASGGFVYQGGAFDQAIMRFSTTGVLFTVNNVSYEPVPPPFMTIGLVNQFVQLTVTSVPGIVIGIASSTNLVDWTTIATMTNLTGSVIYDVTNSPDIPLEFFRSYF